MYFDKLFELLINLWDWIRFWVVLNPNEGGVIITLGKHVRVVGPGVHLKWPLVSELALCDTAIQTMELRPQTITTKDNKSVVVTAIIKFQIKDVKPILLEVTDFDDVLKDTTMGHIRALCSECTFDALRSDKDIEKDVLNLVRADVNRYGFKVYKVTFADLGCIKSIRLIQTQENAPE